ncbi:MAG: hypothetical protein RDU25_00310 [Patescibacteria group bacterium]|nr:hypothetical protein [Patescibacteria group bacterium]
MTTTRQTQIQGTQGILFVWLVILLFGCTTSDGNNSQSVPGNGGVGGNSGVGGSVVGGGQGGGGIGGSDSGGSAGTVAGSGGEESDGSAGVDSGTGAGGTGVGGTGGSTFDGGDSGTICYDPLIECSGTCVNPKTSLEHCGQCGISCGPNQHCFFGICKCNDDNAMLCGNDCTPRDDRSCTDCGIACPERSHCNAVANPPHCDPCASGFELDTTTGACRKPTRDWCGADFLNCAPDQYCKPASMNGPYGGYCQSSCGETDCDGVCTSLGYDSANCGACGNECPSDAVCESGQCRPYCKQLGFCDGVCSDLANDWANCGACGKVCPAWSGCTQGQCDCPGSVCNGQCVDTSTDSNNCGGCDAACIGDSECQFGTCACQNGGIVCSGKCTAGPNDPGNCGSCGHNCPSGTPCYMGTCGCPAYAPILCNGECLSAYNTSNHCGSCGHACPATQYCSNGLCKDGNEPTPVCEAHYELATCFEWLETLGYTMYVCTGSPPPAGLSCLLYYSDYTSTWAYCCK